ncbi:Hypothetical protein R9X50_00601000 [Acrodontium crateriforme]|uniref:Uncharacterized protein n=1 Tax=Acrodontium crateriforme TaxID=150365 RepID=A0AAQ3RBX8_9PEZI|nr:Hypothetical protein R9X50_00601000 [Acrodontium crateriforme]
MHFSFSNTRRKSADSSLSSRSSCSSLDQAILGMTVPIGPREDDYNMSEKERQARIISKCKRASKEPWKSAKPLPERD